MTQDTCTRLLGLLRAFVYQSYDKIVNLPGTSFSEKSLLGYRISTHGVLGSLTFVCFFFLLFVSS